MAELSVVPEGIDAELSLLVEGIEDPAQRNAVIRALFDLSRGQPDTFTVKFAILVKALTLDGRQHPGPGEKDALGRD